MAAGRGGALLIGGKKEAVRGDVQDARSGGLLERRLGGLRARQHGRPRQKFMQRRSLLSGAGQRSEFRLSEQRGGANGRLSDARGLRRAGAEVRVGDDQRFLATRLTL